MPFFETVLTSFLIALSCNIDCFVSGIAYGTDKIKIPLLSTLIIATVCTITLTLSVLLGSVISEVIPQGLTLIICSTLLILIGITKIFGSIIKFIVSKKSKIKKEIRFSLFSLKFILNICNNPENADINKNKVLSIGEAFIVAIAVSLDCLAVGLGAGLLTPAVWDYILIISFSFILSFGGLLLGCLFGRIITGKKKLNLSWLGGLILIGLALLKIFNLV